MSSVGRRRRKCRRLSHRHEVLIEGGAIWVVTHEAPRWTRIDSRVSSWTWLIHGRRPTQTTGMRPQSAARTWAPRPGSQKWQPNRRSMPDKGCRGRIRRTRPPATMNRHELARSRCGDLVIGRFAVRVRASALVFLQVSGLRAPLRGARKGLDGHEVHNSFTTPTGSHGPGERTHRPAHAATTPWEVLLHTFMHVHTSPPAVDFVLHPVDRRSLRAGQLAPS
jgi:hypothetical protein